MATVLELCRVPPAAGAATELSLPLTFLDIHWLPFHPIQRLSFYQFPCSKSYFLDTLVPNLKQSLSLTLKHYVPLAGNILLPRTSGKLKSRYVTGDSVSLTIAESTYDFEHLTGNSARDAHKFHSFVPQLPPEDEESEYKVIPVFALQVTLFPEHGICIGFTNHHGIGDASSIVAFIKAWSSVNRFEGDAHLIEGKTLPFYDRSVIKDPIGIDDIFWSQVQKFMVKSPSLALPSDKVRATFILTQDDIKKLKNLVSAKKQVHFHISSFVVTTAYIWSCLVKSGAATGERVGEDELEFFGFPVDCRARLNPPVPANYFGNCLGVVLAKSTNGELKKSEGFLTAAEVIGETIQKEVHDKAEILEGAKNWLVQLESLIRKRLFGVAGSPRFDLYDADYGWGKPKKYEAVSIDRDGSMSLCKSSELEGGLEVGLSLPKAKMDAFESIFAKGLSDL